MRKPERLETKRPRQNGWVKRKRKEIPLEISIEKRAVKFLEEAGFKVEKHGKHGWPDRRVDVGYSVHIWLEFKRAKCSCLTKAQKRRFGELQRRGELIYVVKSFTDAVETAWRIHNLAAKMQLFA